MDKETRPLIHTTAPDLKVSEALLEEFQEDAEQAKIDGAVAEQLEAYMPIPIPLIPAPSPA